MTSSAMVGRIDPGASYGVTTAFMADTTLINEQSGMLATNAGATATVTLIAPTLPVIGTRFTMRRVESYPFRFAPAASHSVHGGVAGEYIELLGDGFFVLEYVSAGLWIIVSTLTPWKWANGECSDTYDISRMMEGTPGASEVILRHKLPRSVFFLAGLPFSQGIAGTAATAQTDFDIRKNGVSIGTMRFAAASADATFILATQTSFSATDVLTVVAPATPDATLADVSVTLIGVRSRVYPGYGVTYAPTYGHWVEIQLNQTQTDMTDALAMSANIIGADRRWWWKDIEPTEGTYDWTDVDAHLAACVALGKRLVIFLMDKGFNYDGEHPVPADMQIGGANEAELNYTGDAWGAARWHTIWRARMKNILQKIYERYDGQPGFEGVALQETPEAGPWNPPETVNGEIYTNEAAIAAYVDVFENTAAFRPRSYLYWYGTFFGPPTTEIASMALIRDACVGNRVGFGITNTRTWPHQKPDDELGWANSVRKRVLDTTLMSDWADAGMVVFAAHQGDDFKYTSSNGPWRDILYNFEQMTRDTATQGPGGDSGMYDWCANVKRFSWNYQKSGPNATFKQKFDEGTTTNLLVDALSIIEMEPRWWETPAPFAVSAAEFDGGSYLQNQGATALAADGGDFALVFWVNMAGSVDGTAYTLLSMENSSSVARLVVTRDTNNKIAIRAVNSSGADALAAASVKTATSVVASSGWQCVLISGQRSSNTLHLYLYDDNEYTTGTWTSAAADLDFSDITRVTWGATWSGGGAMIGQMAAPYFTNWYVNFSYRKYRRAFFSEFGRPIYAGHNGRRHDAGDGLYGTSFRQPLLCLGNPDTAADWDTGTFAANRGSWCTAEAWSKTGTIATVPANELPSGFPPPPPDPDFTMSTGHWPGTLAMRRQTVTPAADSTAITFVAWVNRTDGFGVLQRLMHMAASTGTERGYIRLNTDNTLSIKLTDAAGTVLVNHGSVGVLEADTGWTCVMISVDQVADRVQIYFNDTQQFSGTCNSTATPISFDTGGLYRWSIGGSYSTANPFTGDLGGLVFHDSVGLDFSVEATRRLFYSVWGNPVDMGSDGSTPFGSQPYVYMGNPGTYAAWNAGTTLNLGSLDGGAAWTKNGTGDITEASPP